MNYNFRYLKKRIIDAITSSDLTKIKNTINSIQGNTLIVGVGGSFPVATFMKKYLDLHNKTGINTAIYPDDINHIPLSDYKNVIVCSYSGKGLTVTNSLSKNLNNYLFSSNPSKLKNTISINYQNTFIKEHSFISLASTLIPMTILLYCHLNQSIEEFITEINKMFQKKIPFPSNTSDIYQIFYNYNSITTCEWLESTITEADLGTPLKQELYNFCHGRSTYTYNRNTTILYLGTDPTDLDHLLKKLLKNYFPKKIYFFKDYNQDPLTNDFYKTIQAFKICKSISSIQKIDLSNIKYSPFVKDVYHFKGSM